MKYRSNIIINIIGQSARVLIAFLISVLVARELGAEGRGYLVYFVLSITMLSNYGHLGINQSTAYFQKKTEYENEKILSSNISFLFIIFILLSVAVFVLRTELIILIDYDLDVIIIGLVYMFTLFMSNVIQEFYIGDERFKDVNKYLIITETLQIALFIPICLCNILSLKSYLIVLLAASTLRLLLLYKNVNLKYNFYVSKSIIFKQLRYGFVAYLSALFIFLNYRIDQLFIKKYEGLEQLGVYSVSVNLAELAFLVPISITSALVGKLYNTSLKLERNKKTSITIRFSFYLSLITIIIGIAMTPLIPKVYGLGFLGAIGITIVLFIGIIFASIGKIAYAYFITEGKPLVHLKVAVLTFTVNLILNILLIPTQGIMGAAIASTVSYFIYGATYILIFILKEGFSLGELITVQPTDIKIIQKIINKKK